MMTTTCLSTDIGLPPKKMPRRTLLDATDVPHQSTPGLRFRSN
jgi:hypothetical protein